MAGNRALASVGATRDRVGYTSRTEELLDRYARDPFAHLDDGHVKVIDLVTLDEVEFRPYDHQRGLLAEWIDLDYLSESGECRWRNTHNEKSRQMGDTWILAWACLWGISYHPSMGLCISMKLEEIDDGGSGSTLDSFFGRIRFMHERMPDRYRAPLRFKHGSITHEFDQRRFIDASGAIPDSGRGGKFHWVMIDEAARIAFAESVHKSIARACPSGRLYNSTPEGEGNVFYRLKKQRPRAYRFVTHHWQLHPVYSRGLHIAAIPNLGPDGEPQDQPVQTTPEARKLAASCKRCAATRAGVVWRADRPESHRYPGKVTSPWYEEAIEDLTDEQVASELDIDYTGSLTGRIYKEFDENRHVSPFSLPIEESAGVELAFDYGVDTTAVVILQELPMEVRVVGEVEVYDSAYPDSVVPEVLRVLRERGYQERLMTKEWTLRMLCVGDPAGEARQQGTGRPLTADYRRHGFRIQSRPRPIDTTITAVKRLLNGRPKPLIVSGPDCPLFVEHAKNNRWPSDRLGNRKPGAREPLNDQHNHMMRAFAYWAAFKFPPPSVEESLDHAASATGDPSLLRGQRVGGVTYDMKL